MASAASGADMATVSTVISAASGGS
jgi:hypothetical protein